jgi:hypothetical protein
VARFWLTATYSSVSFDLLPYYLARNDDWPLCKQRPLKIRIRISRQIRNWIRKYFLIRIRGPGGIVSWKENIGWKLVLLSPLRMISYTLCGHYSFPTSRETVGADLEFVEPCSSWNKCQYKHFVIINFENVDFVTERRKSSTSDQIEELGRFFSSWHTGIYK